MSYPQYGVYLIPPPDMTYPLGLAHQLLAQEFNARTAGRFMVHCTLKGFFKLADGATPADFTPALDELFANSRQFEAKINQFWASPAGSGSSILLWLDRTPALHALHREIWEVVRPYIAPDCRFSAMEPAGDGFVPHITLVQSDLPNEPGLHAQAVALAQYAYQQTPVGPFSACDLQLIEFYSDDWEGAWWESLSYKQLKGWRLG